MGSMNHLEIAAMATSLAKTLIGGQLQKIHINKGHKLVFDIRVPGNNHLLLISLAPDLCRFHEIPVKLEAPQTPPTFCMSLRKYAGCGRLEGLTATPGERVVTLDVVAQQTHVFLVAELIGPGANAFLLDNENRIQDILYPKKARHRGLRIGTPFVPLAPAMPPSGLTVRDFSDDPAGYLEQAETTLAFEQMQKRLLTAVKKESKRAGNYIARMEKERGDLKDPELLRKKGELLAIRMNKLSRGMDKIEVEDIYLPDQPMLLIELDPKLDGPKNVERLFKTSRKNRLRKDGLTQRISQMEDRLLALLEHKQALENAVSIDDLDAIETLLAPMGISKSPPVKGKKNRPVLSVPMEYISADGARILVGRNAKQNDEVTFRIARGNDYWLHVLGEPSSHVVVLIGKSGTLKQETLLDAATLALLGSKKARQGNGEVIYTRRKYVTKPKGAPPGRVTYSQSKTIYVRLEPDRIARLVGEAQINF